MLSGVQAQRVEHGRGLTGKGVGASRGVGAGEEPERPEEILRVRGGKASEHAFQQRALPAVMRGGDVEIGEIAAAVAGREELFPDAGQSLEDGAAPSRARKQGRRAQSRRTAADDADVFR